MYFLINLFGVCGALGLSRAIYEREKTLIIFSNIFSLFWGASLLISMTYAGGLLRVSISTLLVLYAAWLALLFGALIVLRFSRQPVVKSIGMIRKRAFYALAFLLVANACSIYFDVGMNMMFHSTNLSDLINDLATARIQGELVGNPSPPLLLGIFRYAFVLYIPLASIMLRKKWISTTWFLFICAGTVVVCLSSFTRGPLVQLILTLFISLFVAFPEYRPKLVAGTALSGLIVIAGFVTMQAMLSDSGNIDGFSDSLVSYAGGPMKAYDMLLHGQYPVQTGPAQGRLYSLEAANYAFQRMGLIGEHPSLVREVIFLPFPTNVYTFLDAFTLDFGPLGAILGAFGIGMLVALIYRRRNCYWGLTAYCLTTYYLVMAGINNEFIRFSFPLYLSLAWLVQRFVFDTVLSRNCPA